ncbi:Hypothetical protein FKW44_013464 [Caligus rogercresseyi]|uniref:Uncharacterized protein n=1 Tax=Caligus rogercresseyi TaxID=217165 RepID=A0A7T8HKX6_CALRO|nr:Hypothetical protein FKW44_013464 [Caligus rogercresseyi]
MDIMDQRVESLCNFTRDAADDGRDRLIEHQDSSMSLNSEGSRSHPPRRSNRPKPPPDPLNCGPPADYNKPSPPPSAGSSSTTNNESPGTISGPPCLHERIDHPRSQVLFGTEQEVPLIQAAPERSKWI